MFSKSTAKLQDDVESWVYMLIELTRATLPWKSIVDKQVPAFHRVLFTVFQPFRSFFVSSHIHCLLFVSSPGRDGVEGERAGGEAHAPAHALRQSAARVPTRVRAS